MVIPGRAQLVHALARTFAWWCVLEFVVVFWSTVYDQADVADFVFRFIAAVAIEVGIGDASDLNAVFG